jgi:hypothetical protein
VREIRSATFLLKNPRYLTAGNLPKIGLIGSAAKMQIWVEYGTLLEL